MIFSRPLLRQSRLLRNYSQNPGHLSIKQHEPYWYNYNCFAKGRWANRTLLDIFCTDFQSFSAEDHRRRIVEGAVTLNGRHATPETVVKINDVVSSRVHRHESAILDLPVKTVEQNPKAGYLVVDKPPSIPVHPCGAWNNQTITNILQKQYGIQNIFVPHRLDRLTSGLLFLATTAETAKIMGHAFRSNGVQKTYLARCEGRFPEEEIICEEPILGIAYGTGINIVHPQGSPSKTVFNLLRYDPESNTSLVSCQPITGRTHQIRVHLQFLGHPITNDRLYGSRFLWGDKLAKGGIDTSSIPASKSNIALRGKIPGVEADSAGNPTSPTQLSEEARNILQRFWTRKVRSFSVIVGPTLKHPPVDTLPTCPEPSCKQPIYPPPRPEELFICLHSWKLECELGSFEVELPFWTEERWSLGEETKGWL